MSRDYDLKRGRENGNGFRLGTKPKGEVVEETESKSKRSLLVGKDPQWLYGSGIRM